MQNNNLYPRISFENPTAVPISDALQRIMSYEKSIDIYRLNLTPLYQRGQAWLKEFKDKLIYSLITHYPIGNFIVRKLQPKTMVDPTHEVVDGQQRLLAIRDFVEKGMELSPMISRTIVKENLDYYIYDIDNKNISKEAKKVYDAYTKNPDKANIKITFTALPSILQRRINGHNLTIVHVDCEQEAIQQYFRFIQNQEKLRAGEIINAIPDSPASEWLARITKKNAFLQAMNWNESRREFDKIFYSMLGIFDNKLLYGTTDKAIIDYVTNFKKLGTDAEDCANKMIVAINAIASLSPQTIRFNKRLLKFFFLLAGYGKVDFTSDSTVKLKALVDLNNIIAKFNSHTAEQIKPQLVDYTEAQIEQFREIYLFGRGSHSKNVVNRRLEIMKQLIDAMLAKQGVQ